MSSFAIPSLFNVKDKVVLITGGSRGIGKAIATAFVANGAKVYVSSRSAKDCDATASELTALGPGTCHAIPADIQKYSEVERLVKELSAKESALHVLVNNAGAAWGEGIDEFPDSAWTKVLTLNTQRVFTLTQKCLPLLRAAAKLGGIENDVHKDPARIINIGSVEALSVQDHETYAYAASKAALHHLSRSLAGRLGWEGITSNTIACGPFETKMMAHTLKVAGDVILESTPLHRVGKPEEVGGTAVFLASPAAAWMTGATIALDGGGLVGMKSFRDVAKL
ncbi:hypothetical protein BC629DRAFT_1593037 [Irpex lacteus]|nr:hypothetical protein BC629DRAFT_1593037 [Irpex lacteus]